MINVWQPKKENRIPLIYKLIWKGKAVYPLLSTDNHNIVQIVLNVVSREYNFFVLWSSKQVSECLTSESKLNKFFLNKTKKNVIKELTILLITTILPNTNTVSSACLYLCHKVSVRFCLSVNLAKRRE